MGSAPPRQRFESLTGLRFFLAIWIAYFHAGLMYDKDGFATLPYVELGTARVDVFFALSGFVLAHVYWATRTKPFDFADFFVARVARVYPLHVLALLVMVGYVIAGIILGRTEQIEAYTLGSFIGNLLMLQAFGWPDGNIWNFPVWAVSAEFAGYAAFPLYIWLANVLKNRPLVFFGICLGNILAVDLLHHVVLNRPMSESTVEFGALRGAVVMLAGVGARAAFEKFQPHAFLAGVISLIGVAFAILAAIYHWGTAFVVLGGSLIIMGLARIDQVGKPTFLSGKTMINLGAWSYGIFIIHVPLYFLIENALEMIGINLTVNAWTSFILLAAAIVVSWPLHILIEKPCQKGIRDGWNHVRKRKKAVAGETKAAE